jgi:hypothetical protein
MENAILSRGCPFFIVPYELQRALSGRVVLRESFGEEEQVIARQSIMDGYYDQE